MEDASDQVFYTDPYSKEERSSDSHDTPPMMGPLSDVFMDRDGNHSKGNESRVKVIHLFLCHFIGF